MSARIFGAALALFTFYFGKYTIDGNSMYSIFTYSALFAIGVFIILFNPKSVGEALSYQSIEKAGWKRMLVAKFSIIISFLWVFRLFSDQQKNAELIGMKLYGIVTQGYISKAVEMDQAGTEHEESESVSEEQFSKSAIGMPVDIIYNPKDFSQVDVLFTPEDRAKYGK